MTALTLAGTADSPNHVLNLTENNLYPLLRRGDAVLWQSSGFVADGFYVCDVGHGRPNVYLVQSCRGGFRLITPQLDLDPRTQRVKDGVKPQEVDRDAFESMCLGYVIAELKVNHAGALFGRERLPGRRLTARQVEHA